MHPDDSCGRAHRLRARAHAEAGPCKTDQFNGLTCGAGPGAARVTEGTASPDNRLAFAWRDPGKAPTEEQPDIYNVESVLIQLHDGRALAMAPGGFWNTGAVRVNRYDFHAIWSPDSNYVIELLDFRWNTETLRLYALREGAAPLSLDLKPIIELAVRKYLRKTVKNEASYAFEIQGDNSGEPPRLAIDNRGVVKTRIEMQVPKAEDPEIYVDVVFRVGLRDGALEARPVSIRRSKDRPEPCS